MYLNIVFNKILDRIIITVAMYVVNCFVYNFSAIAKCSLVNYFIDSVFLSISRQLCSKIFLREPMTIFFLCLDKFDIIFCH